MGHGSPSTKYEVNSTLFYAFKTLSLIFGLIISSIFASNIPSLQVNEKRDKEKKGVDNDAYDGKKESDVEKGNEKDEKWKNNYVPFDESKEKENE